MHKTMFALLIGLFCFSPTLHAEASLSASAVLKAADNFRKPDGSARIKLEVLLFQHGKLDSRKQYTVYMAPGRRSLALFNSPGEQGQKALQLENRFYLLLPKSRRPVRISPMQKLLGEAAIGDISTMTWSEDYHGSIVDDAAMIGDTPAIQLKLVAKQDGVTYEQVELWVSRHDFMPIQARLFLKSGRIAKEVTYQAGTRNGKTMVIAMVMKDRIQQKKRTEIHYRSIEAVDVPDRYFNPAYLSRNHVE